ncbi:hypothetical protein BH11ACT8_BH11ACT8_25860 [soil metagenome]
MLGGFADAARARSADRPPRVCLVVMGDDEEARDYHEKFLAVLRSVGLDDVAVQRVPEGSPCPAEALEDLDGLFVGGGPTPEYHASLSPLYARIRDLVSGGLPYAGFSAGAAIAATNAIIGGWTMQGRPVCPEESNEDLDDVCVVAGIGLVPGAIDVHAAQWGNLSRLVAVVEAGLAPSGTAVDECATLALPSGTRHGAGAVWQVDGSAGATSVTRQA